MTSRENTNDNKRAEMKAIMAKVLTVWTRKEVAAVMYVSTSAVSQWSNGKSMGTNDQRAKLAAFAGQSRAEVVAAALGHLALAVANAEANPYFSEMAQARRMATLAGYRTAIEAIQVGEVVAPAPAPAPVQVVEAAPVKVVKAPKAKVPTIKVSVTYPLPAMPDLSFVFAGQAARIAKLDAAIAGLR